MPAALKKTIRTTVGLTAGANDLGRFIFAGAPWVWGNLHEGSSLAIFLFEFGVGVLLYGWPVVLPNVK